MIGESIAHYKILEKLGAGGMGEVYLAEDKDLDRKVALKFLPERYTNDAELNRRFKREAKAIAALNHPNIITVHEIAEFNGRAYIAMEYVHGESLREEIKKGPVSIARMVEILMQICEGLSEAHQAGIVHRDIKPENILIDKSRRVKILDFGLALMKDFSRMTKDESTLGTLKYMSPEQYQSTEVTHRTDIWSFGVVLFEMLTGQLPFRGDYEAAVMYSVINEEPKSAFNIRGEVTADLDQIISKSLEKDPDNRYQDFEAVISDLKESSGAIDRDRFNHFRPSSRSPSSI